MKELRSSISPKQRNIDFYLESMGIENFKALEVYSTGGDWRPPYPFQWHALSIPFGDDSLEGIGKTPLEAMRNLYKEFKKFENSDFIDED